jgi:signal transduction histidine kinase/putative methionine-R-sulfoxide reductase with GAF domain
VAVKGDPPKGSVEPRASKRPPERRSASKPAPSPKRAAKRAPKLSSVARSDEACAADAARLKELEHALERSERTVHALRDVGLALGSTLDLDQLLELILNKITELLDADRATLYLLDETRGRLLSRIMVGEEARSIELPLGQGIAGYVAKTGRVVRVKDAYRDKRFLRQWDDLTGYRTRAILAAPMKNHVGRTIGVIQVLNKDGSDGEFSLHDEELLTALATQAAVSIDNSRLFLSVIQKNMQLVETKEQLEHRVADLKLLFELEMSMSGASTMEDLARAVVVEATRACDARAGAVMVDEADAGVWLYFVENPVGPKPVVKMGDAPIPSDDDGVDVDGSARVPSLLEVKRVPMKRNEGLIGWSMVHREAICMPQDAARLGDQIEGPVSARLNQMLQLSAATAIAVPLDGERDEAVGAIALYNSNKPLGFSQDDRALLRLVSANASTAVRLFRSRQERERSERLSTIGRLLSGVMHDMRTPLTVIGGYVQLMTTATDPAQRADHARLIVKQFEVLGAMQREVLEFARGQRSILVRKVYLTKFFEDLEKQLKTELDGTGVKLHVVLEDRGTARFDESKVTRALHNLTRNGAEAMAAHGGTLTIKVSREGGELVISVSDTGSGIPKEIEGRLFQSFVTSGKRGGTGLGLAIVKKIVDEHTGSVSVHSTPRGATFTLRLPQEGPPVTVGDEAHRGGASA